MLIQMYLHTVFLYWVYAMACRYDSATGYIQGLMNRL
jgi:hypothetical protein